MKRNVLIALMLGMVLALSAATNQVTIKLTTSVPEILIHGFLKDGNTTEIFASESKDHAFDPNGVAFTYAVKTNTSIPMTVYASVTPFSRTDAEDPLARVSIEKILVKGDGGSETAATNVGNDDNGLDRYQLVSFTPNRGGMATYSYTLTVVANQSEVQDAPAGQYQSTVSIGITTGN